MKQTQPSARGDAFAAAAGELIDEVQSTIRPDEATVAPERRSPWVLPGALAVVFVAVAGWNVWLLQAASPRLTATEERRADGVMVFVATQAVEDYAADHGRLPERLEDAGLEAPGVEYTARPDGFAIASARGDAPIRYDRSERVDDFMLRMGIAPPDVSLAESNR
ncbi:MAG: hypothetical protein RLN75_08685 [Longimicrobiales bacterium]